MKGESFSPSPPLSKRPHLDPILCRAPPPPPHSKKGEGRERDQKTFPLEIEMRRAEQRCEISLPPPPTPHPFSPLPSFFSPWKSGTVRLTKRRTLNATFFSLAGSFGTQKMGLPGLDREREYIKDLQLDSFSSSTAAGEERV